MEPPVLSYADRDMRAGISIASDDSGVTVLIQAEPYRVCLRRALASPWTWFGHVGVVSVLLSQAAIHGPRRVMWWALGYVAAVVGFMHLNVSQLSRQSGRIEVRDGQLTCSWFGAWGGRSTRSRAWKVKDLRSVKVGLHGLKIAVHDPTPTLYRILFRGPEIWFSNRDPAAMRAAADAINAEIERQLSSS